jgi:hypothetical protein
VIQLMFCVLTFPAVEHRSHTVAGLVVGKLTVRVLLQNMRVEDYNIVEE